MCVHVCMSVFGLVSHIHKEDLEGSHIYTMYIYAVSWEDLKVSHVCTMYIEGHETLQ